MKNRYMYSVVSGFCVVLFACCGGAPQTAESSAVQTETRLTNSIGMELILIPAGTVTVGSESGFPDELPLRDITLSTPFYMGVNEVTQQQFETVMGQNPSAYQGEDLPVEQVSWEMATEFCRRLSEREGRSYRLPSEVEWSYAARGGRSDITYVWGNAGVPMIGEAPAANVADESAAEAYPDLKIFSGYRDGFVHTAPVGSFLPNPFGLYDMAGNVWEWTSWWYVEDWYAQMSSTDPLGPERGERRTFRGGSWDDGPQIARIALRGILHDGQPKSTNGFRVVLEIE